MFILRKDGSCTWQSGLGAAQEAVVTTAPSEPLWLSRVNAFLDTPVVAAATPETAPKPAVGVDWLFWAKSAGIAGAVVLGFMWLTKI